jgi:hypothetical protein
MHTQLDNNCFNGLLKLAAEAAGWQLNKDKGFNAFFIFIKSDEIAGCVMEMPVESNESFELFTKATRDLAIAKNVTEGMLVNLFELASDPTPDNPAREYLLLVYQSRNEALTYVLPVYRKVDGVFSHLGQAKQAQHFPWLANIVPGQEPSKAARTAAEGMLQKHKLSIVF